MSDNVFGSFDSTTNILTDSGPSKQQRGAESAQCIVKCPDLGFTCNVAGFETDSTPCIDFEIGGSRLNTYDSSGELNGDGQMSADDAIVYMKYGSWGPLIQQRMYNGNTLSCISIIRLASIEKSNEIVQQIDFENCLIKTYKQKRSFIMFSFSFAILRDTSNKFTHDAQLVGAVATEVNYPAMTVKS